MSNHLELAKRFNPISSFREEHPDYSPYQLLPFNFARMDGMYLLSNDAGDFALIERHDLQSLVHGTLRQDGDVYRKLRAKHFLYDSTSDVALDLLALKIRTKQTVMRDFTSLHLFVVTLRCDYSCPYCQVSRQTQDRSKYDMSEKTAEKGLEHIFRSPAKDVKIEFQGGEPLLNFELIKFIVNRANELNQNCGKNIQFVIATNLSFINDDILQFCERYDIYISTSLDGPVGLHNKNRPRPGKDGYERTRNGIEQVRQRLGPSHVAALMTTTEASLSRPKEIIDEYLDAGFNSIFLRPLSPYGFAVKTRQIQKYDMLRFFEFYKEALSYIFDLNLRGVPFREEYTSLVLRKLLSPYPTSYVDLQSPAGAGVSVIVFNYDGKVYPTDESRMLAEMGDDRFCLGSLEANTYEEIFLNPTLLQALEESLTYSAPECCECVFQPYCGSDPTYHYATQHDWVGHKEFSGFCHRTKLVTSYLIKALDEDNEYSKILLGWARI